MTKLSFAISALLFSCLMIGSVSAQDNPVIVIRTEPKNAIVRLDSMRYTQGQYVQVDTGAHQLQVWAPKRKLITKKIHVTQDSMSFAIGLPFSEEYRKFIRSKGSFKLKKSGLKCGPSIVFLTLTTMGLFSISDLNQKADQHYQDALIFKREAETSFWLEEIEDARFNFEVSKSAYSDVVKQRNQIWTAIGIGAGLTALTTYFTVKLANRMKEPEFQEEPKLSYLEVSPEYRNGAYGFQMNFTF